MEMSMQCSYFNNLLQNAFRYGKEGNHFIGELHGLMILMFIFKFGIKDQVYLLMKYLKKFLERLYREDSSRSTKRTWILGISHIQKRT